MYKRVLLAIIVVGVAVYSRQYFFDSNLWLDEARIALDIIRVPVSQFFHQPLMYEQAAPVGFLVVEKLFVMFGGISEMVLRLFPFICGLLSLWLFFLMARIYLDTESVPLALFSFVVTPSLIYYTGEIKPYMTDVMATLLCYVGIAEVFVKEVRFSRIILAALLGVVLIGFSFPVVFVLLAVLVTTLFHYIVKAHWRMVYRLLVVLICWFMVSSIYYIVLLHGFKSCSYGPLWQGGFISFSRPATWFGVFNNFLNDLFMFAPYLGVIIFISLCGIYGFFKEDKKKFLFICLPFVLVLLASGFHIYSFTQRLTLFLVPLALLTIIKGIRVISLRCGRYSVIAGILITALLFYNSAAAAWKGFMDPRYKVWGEWRARIGEGQGTRRAVAYLKDHKRSHDVVYIYFDAKEVFEYYALRLGLPFSSRDFVGGACSWHNQGILKKDLNRFQGVRRFWILFSNVYDGGTQINDKDFCLGNLLKLNGKILDSFSAEGASVYLFDLTSAGRQGLIK